MYKSLLFAFSLLVQSSLFSQGLFKGDKTELDIVTKLGKIPSITVLDKTGKKYQLEKYMEANKRHKDKPFLLVVWGIGEQTGVTSLRELAKNELADQYNIVSIFIDYKLENADRMNEQVKKASTEKSWDKFILLSTNFDELEKGFYLKEYPKHIYAASNLDVITVYYVQPYTGAESLLSNIRNGLKKGEGIWYTDDGIFSKKDDSKAKFYNQYKVDGDNIFFTSNSKSKLLQKITYLKKGEEYLYNGELLTQTETGQKTGTGRFKEGVPVESYNTWYADGKKQFEYPVNGTAKGYDKMGKISFESQIVNGLGNGISTYYENEKKTSVYNYKAGVLSGIQKKFWGNGDVTEWFESPDYESGWYLYEGLQRIKKNDMWGYADRTGRIIIPIKYSFVDDFSEGKANVKLNDLYGYIDKTGKVVIPFQYTYADKFKNGIANVTTNGESFDIDKKGVRIKEEQITTSDEEEEKEEKEEKQYDRLFFWKNGFRKVELNKKYGFLDTDGNEITAIEYDEAWDFSDGMAAVKKDGKMGFIDDKGKLVVPLKYLAADAFENGKARVAIFKDGENKFGYIDKTGKEIIPIKYGFPSRLGDDFVAVRVDGKYAILDWTGKTIQPPIFSTINAFYDGMARVQIEEKYGFINEKAQIAIPAIYDNAEIFKQGVARVLLNGNWKNINRKGEIQ